MTKDMEYLLNINGIEIMQDTVATFGSFFIYIIAFAAILILAKFFFPIPQNVFRKMLHIVAFTSSIYVVLNGESWIADTITLLVFALIVYPALRIAEKWKGYSKLFVEKKPGEICNSLLLLFISQSILVAFTCGFLQKPYILVAATAAWGLGDIAAAWIGRPFGIHKIMIPFADKNKTWEGSIAMAFVAFIACLFPIAFMSHYSIAQAVIVSVIVALISAYTELITKGGNDTVTVPVANTVVLWLLSYIF